MVEEYKDGHGCYIALGVKDAKDVKIDMTAGGDNEATLVCIAGAFVDIAKERGVKPSALLPFITDRLVKESA